jgi:hypothetical protein
MAQPTDTDENRNRIRTVSDSLNGTEDPDDLMIKLMEVMNEGDKMPEVGKHYIFVYTPKTPNIRYDQNPLVAVTDIFAWGFRGVNYHWGTPRQYTWNEVGGGLFEAYPAEIKDLQLIPFGNFQLNN